MTDDFGREFGRHRRFIHRHLRNTRLQLAVLIGSGIGGASWLAAYLLAAPHWTYTGTGAVLGTGCLLLALRRPRWADGTIAAFLDARWDLPATLAAALSANGAHPFRQLLLKRATSELARRDPAAPRPSNGHWYLGPALLGALLIVEAVAPPALDPSSRRRAEASGVLPEAMPSGQQHATSSAPAREGLRRTRDPSGHGPAQVRQFCPTCSAGGVGMAPSTRQALAVAAALLAAQPATASLAEATRNADAEQLGMELAKLAKTASLKQKQRIERQTRLAYEALRYAPERAPAPEAQALADAEWGPSDRNAPAGGNRELAVPPSPATELRSQPLTPPLGNGVRVPAAAKRTRHRADVELSALLQLLRAPLPEAGLKSEETGGLGGSAKGPHRAAGAALNGGRAHQDAPRLSRPTRGKSGDATDHEGTADEALEPRSATVALPLHGAASAQDQYWSGSARGTLHTRRRSLQRSPASRRSEPAAELRGVNAVRVPRSYREQVSRYFSGGS